MTAHSDVSQLEPKGTLQIYSREELLLVNPQKVPSHVAIVMDGNRRWANEHNLPSVMGHWEGAEVLTDILRAASEIGVKALTVYSFSTENWSRADPEIDALMNIFELYLIQKKEMMVKEGVRLCAIGDRARLPKKVQKAFDETQKATAHCDKIDFILALNYGGRDDLKRAMKKIFQNIQEGRLTIEDLSEDVISQFLDTSAWSDPELIIRTSGELRLSNFLLWQASYSELYITDVLWPDFSPKTFLNAILAYQERKRRWGGAC